MVQEVKMSKQIESTIECPFYIKEDNISITCEGAIKGTNCVHTFNTKEEKVKHETNVCSYNCGKKCFHYRTLSIMYERGILA